MKKQYTELKEEIKNPFKDGGFISYIGNLSKDIHAEFPEDTHKYFVIVEGKSAPTKIHNSLGGAKHEANRLAKLENKNTYVVEIKNKYGTEIKELTI